MSTEPHLRAAAAAAFRNAELILSDAGLLYAAGRWARTLSLAIIGQEELGKAVIYTVAALDRLPGLREVLLVSGRHDPARDHEFKQSTAETASIAHFMVEDLILNSDGMAGPADDVAWLDAVIRGSAEWLHEAGVTRGRQARHAFLQRYRRRLEALTYDLPPPLQRDGTDDLETQKWRGLYVDLEGDTLHEPRRLGEFEARSARADLGINLTALWRFQACFEDDDMWARLDRTPVAVTPRNAE